MAITVAGVTAKEMWDSFRKGRNESGPTVTLSYLVDFSQADTFVDGCMGGFVRTGGAGGTTEYVPKLACPQNPTLFCMRAEYEGVGEADTTGGGRATFSEAKVTLTYEVPNYPMQASDDPGGIQSFVNEPGQPILYAECDIDLGGEYLTVPGQTLKFTVGGEKIDQELAIFDPVATFRITRHYFPYLPTEKVMDLIGKVNDATFLGRPQGYVRFAGARTRQVKTSEGLRSQMWELVFEVKTHDWNRFLKKGSWAFQLVESADGSGALPYIYANLKPLLSY